MMSFSIATQSRRYVVTITRNPDIFQLPGIHAYPRKSDRRGHDPEDGQRLVRGVRPAFHPVGQGKYASDGTTDKGAPVTS